MFDIIIPVYNNRKLLQKALSSLFVQTLSHTLDIYIIDDGSQESYEDIVSYYADSEKFHNIFLLTNPKNMGVGYCRQKAIEISKEMTNNPWIFFLDSDDYLYSPYAFNRLRNTIIQNPLAKLIQGASIMEHTNLKEFYKELPQYLDIQKTDSDTIIYFHSKLYNRKMLEKAGFTIPTTRCYEDFSFNLAVNHYLREDEIINLSNIITCICFNPNSITREDNSIYRVFNQNGEPNCAMLYSAFLAHRHCFFQLIEAYKKQNKEILFSDLNYFFDAYLDLFKMVNEQRKRFEHPGVKLNMMILWNYYNDIILPMCNYDEEKIDAYWDRVDIKKIWWAGPSKLAVVDISKLFGENYDEEEYQSLLKTYVSDYFIKEE